MAKELSRGEWWKTYLGDGLYAEFDGFQVHLWASDGQSCTNEVFLEPSVLQAFEQFVVGLKVPR